MKLLPQFTSRREDDDISHLLNTIHHADAIDLLARLQTTDPFQPTVYKDGRTQLSLFEDVS